MHTGSKKYLTNNSINQSLLVFNSRYIERSINDDYAPLFKIPSLIFLSLLMLFNSIPALAGHQPYSGHQLRVDGQDT